jgi:hypothetical protein
MVRNGNKVSPGGSLKYRIMDAGNNRQRLFVWNVECYFGSNCGDCGTHVQTIQKDTAPLALSKLILIRVFKVMSCEVLVIK